VNRDSVALVRYILVIIVSLLSLQGAEAANIEVRRLVAGGSLVIVEGDIELGDIEQFRTKVAAISKASVAFQSDGGSLLAGIRIGTLIRMKNFVTVVPDGAQCASACAVAWLGGTRRFVGAASKVGFHAAYVLKTSGAAESAPGNAVLGAYLNQLGLREEAIVYITQAAPTSMKWLSLDEASLYGIDVALLPPSQPQPAKPASLNVPATKEQPTGGLQRRAMDFVLALGARWSGPNTEALRSLDDLYADRVVYHGKATARQAVLLDKRRFAERWPERSYRIRANSVSATCVEAVESCRVKGVMDWELANATKAAKSRGVSNFEYNVTGAGDELKIAAEKTSLDVHQKPPKPSNPLTSVQRSLKQLVAQLTRLRQAPKESTSRPNAPIPR
jgi:hypothetical protein